MNEEIKYDVWLSLALGAGSRTITPLFEAFETAKEIYEERDHLAEHAPIKPEQMKGIQNTTMLAAEEICDACERQRCVIIPHTDERLYPAKLREIIDFPPVLYASGTFVDLNDCVSIGVVGTRHPTEYAVSATEVIVKELAQAGICIISGLAVGIDAKAHEAALSVGGKTVAFLGCGTDANYPAQNADLRKRLETDNMVLSEYPPGVRPEGWHFPIRNRLISGASMGVFVVEGSRRSGTLHTANHALEQGRDVYALPGNIFNSKFDGVFSLLKQGAAPVREGMDIIENYVTVYPKKIVQGKERLLSEKRDTPVQAQKCRNFSQFEGIQRQILEHLGAVETAHLEEISELFTTGAATLLSELTELEVLGVVRALSGKRYKLA